MHTAVVLTRNDFWEFHAEMDAANLQSTFEMCTILRMPHIVHPYDCGRFVPTNGVNFIGSPRDFQFTPKESWQARYLRLSRNRVLHCIDHARKQNLLELMALLGDTCVRACFTLFLERIRSSEPMPVGPCRRCGSVINLACYVCPACSGSFPFVDP